MQKIKGHLIMSCEYPAFAQALKAHGFNVIAVAENAQLDKTICCHADCNFLSFDNSVLYFDSSQNNIVNNLTNTNVEKIQIQEKIKSPYPNDVGLNARLVGNFIICNELYVNSQIKAYAENIGYQLIHCNQGYAACSTVAISNNALITDDESIYNACISNEIDCLKVSKGAVKLNGYEYGFIGGCCSMIDDKCLAFAGNLNTHPDSYLIKKFLAKYDVEYINLTDDALTDIGGIIPLKQ